MEHSIRPLGRTVRVLVKIYTKGGDDGETSLLCGGRIPKDRPHLEAMGALDECNSALGMALAAARGEERLKSCRQRLKHVQERLFDLGTQVAIPLSKAGEEEKAYCDVDFSQEAQVLEGWIDALTETLPPLKNFILPGGHPVAAAVHSARAISRRAERFIVTLYQRGDVDQSVVIYSNRLSDFLFTLARSVNQSMDVEDSLWKGKDS